jgi:hypothetical protein
MPMSYRIEPDRALVLTEAWGVLTDQDILTHKAKLLSDPAFNPAMAQISDVRRIERLDVTTAGVRAMVGHDAANADRRLGHRMALVVPSDSAFGMARMYQQLGGHEDGSVGVFRTMEEARAWLAVVLADAPATSNPSN